MNHRRRRPEDPPRYRPQTPPPPPQRGQQPQPPQQGHPAPQSPPRQSPPRQPPPRPPGSGRHARGDDRPEPDDSLTELLWLDHGELADSEDYDSSDDHRSYDEYGYADAEYPDDGYDYGYSDEYDEGYDDHAGYDDYDDGYDDRADPEYFDDERDEEPRDGGRRGKRALSWLAALGVIVLLAGGAYFGARELLGFGYDDYEGTGKDDIIIEVEDGETTRQIAVSLAKADVVASAEAFVAASEESTKIRGIQPGYYVLKTKMSGSSAVEAIVAEQARVGHFQVRPGLQLADIKMPDGSVTEGILSRLSHASCAKLNGHSTCVSVEKLRKTVADGDLAALGVPDWAVDNAAKAQDVRKIEGLIAPGHYNVRPGSSATELLRQVFERSTARLQAAGLPDAAADTGHDPYEVLIIASLIQREAIKPDFEKVARVIYNRLEQDMELGLDSTINYVQKSPTVRTSDEERAKQGPYNTYLNTGLPPTPISAPSPEAIDAAANPADGAWLYFVKCETNGKSCFSETYAEHQQKAADARARGVY